MLRRLGEPAEFCGGEGMNRKRTNEEDRNADLVVELLKVIAELKFIVAHKVRAPIATAIGLVILLNNETTTKEDKEKMLGYLLDTINEMDVHTKQIMSAMVQVEQTFIGNSFGDKEGGLAAGCAKK